MTAMPHAGVDSEPANTYVSQRSGGYSRGLNLDKIKDNGMSGHVDVHFLNSKTHGSNKVDAKHQAAIKEAAKYQIEAIRQVRGHPNLFFSIATEKFIRNKKKVLAN